MYKDEDDELESGIAGSAVDGEVVFVDAVDFHCAESLIPGVVDWSTGRRLLVYYS